MRKLDMDALNSLYDAPMPLALDKVARRLTSLYTKWIQGSRFCILSTVGPDGVHGSPRGDAGPVVRVTDDQTLMMPDWWGNNRLDCLKDIVQDGRVALLFLVPGSTTTVRVNGTAFLTDDTDLRSSFEHNGKLPKTIIVIAIDEVYTQCAKALLRSGLWLRDDKHVVPSIGDILADMTDGREGGAEYDKNYVEYAKPRMW